MTIKTETADGVARIEIARPEKKNAITAAMYTQMAEAIARAHEDKAVRAILIHGQPDIFTAGNDVEDFLRFPLTADPAHAMDAPPYQFIKALGFAEKPVVAAVNGAAVGIGTTMLMHCDLVYCADNAMFSMPFVALGICSEFASSLTVPLNAGYHKAAEKLLLSDPISAEEALDMKIVNRILPPAEVLPYARKQAMRFNALPPNSVRETKRLMKSGWKAAMEKVLLDEATTFNRMLVGAEAKEAFSAFLERRKPDFSKFA
jgi:enoyl-CoA hydratase/carnithine racemase